MAALTTKDFDDLHQSIKVISHITEDSKRPFIEWLKIIEYVAVEASLLFFKNGKPKTTMQLIMTIPAIVGFVRKLIKMIKGEVDKKPKRSLEQKTVDAVEAGRLNAKPKSTDNK